MSGQTVFLGLSGGVDSAVSAYLLKQQGYKVVGVFMKNWSGENYGVQFDCPWEEDMKSAMAVAEFLDIEFMSFNFEKEYRAKVIEYFFSEYEKGNTPNPDVMCNKEIKFKLFLEKSQTFNADFIATGHYARRNVHSDNSISLYEPKDLNKDQTYFLYNITQAQLSKTLFPLENLDKSEVRELAKRLELPNADRPDSQGICFLGEIDVFKFLQSKLPTTEGDIVDISTKKVVGRHKGVWFYTIGQREGLNLGGLKIPHYVVSKDVKTNTLYVGDINSNLLYTTHVKLESLHIINQSSFEKLDLSNLSARARYRQPLTAGTLEKLDSSHQFTFNSPVKAVAPGQSLVIYSNGECVGGGIITSAS